MKLKYLLVAAVFACAPTWANVQIVEPANSRAYHRFSQNIEVKAVASPALSSEETAAILLNDKVVADGLTATISTADLIAGEYTLTAIIMDKNAKTIASDSKTVYVIHKGALNKKKAEAIANREAYEASPWYKKLAIGINPKVQAPQDVDATTPTWEIK